MGRATDRKRKEDLKAKKKAMSKTSDSSAAPSNSADLNNKSNPGTTSAAKTRLKVEKEAVSKTPASSVASKNSELQIHHAVSSTHSEPSEKQISTRKIVQERHL
jgi:hypothetical protein